MNIEYVRADALRNVHGRLIETYGGLQGMRDENGLHSAIARPRQLNHYTGEKRIGILAASLSWALLRNHPFADGNKRTAFAAMTMAVELNNHRLTCSDVEETAMVLRAAASELTEEGWTDWVQGVVAAK